MTIVEIRDLIAKKISGQGTMVDVGGGLPAILNGILDLIPAALKNIPDAGVVTSQAREITFDEFLAFTSKPIVSYTRDSEQVFGCICSNDNLVDSLLAHSSADEGSLFLEALRYDSGEVSVYRGIFFYFSQDRYFKKEVEL